MYKKVKPYSDPLNHTAIQNRIIIDNASYAIDSSVAADNASARSLPMLKLRNGYPENHQAIPKESMYVRNSKMKSFNLRMNDPSKLPISINNQIKKRYGSVFNNQERKTVSKIESNLNRSSKMSPAKVAQLAPIRGAYTS